MKCQPMIMVRDVAESSAWYRQLLGLTSGHGGDEFEMLMAGNELLLMLHHSDFLEHPVIPEPVGGVLGAGVLLYFTVGDVDAHFERALEMKATVFGEPHLNPKARSIELHLRDPDGYALTISQWAG